MLELVFASHCLVTGTRLLANCRRLSSHTGHKSGGGLSLGDGSNRLKQNKQQDRGGGHGCPPARPISTLQDRNRVYSPPVGPSLKGSGRKVDSSQWRQPLLACRWLGIRQVQHTLVRSLEPMVTRSYGSSLRSACNASQRGGRSGKEQHEPVSGTGIKTLTVTNGRITGICQGLSRPTPTLVKSKKCDGGW